MRASPEVRPHLLASRMQFWLDIIRTPILYRGCPTWRARRNYRALVRKYPQIAERLGYTEAMSYQSPLHGLPPAEPPLIEPPAPPAAETPASPSPALFRGVSRTMLLDDEVL